jgi:hypothetical protein
MEDLYQHHLSLLSKYKETYITIGIHLSLRAIERSLEQ